MTFKLRSEKGIEKKGIGGKLAMEGGYFLAEGTTYVKIIKGEGEMIR